MPDSDNPCETLWIKSPGVLLSTQFGTRDLCVSNNINAFSRAAIVGFLVAGVLSPALGFSGFAIVLLALLALYGRWLFETVIPSQGIAYAPPERVTKPNKEGFEVATGANIRPDLLQHGVFADAPKVIATRPGVAVVTRPTAANPFMNVLLDEIKYNPTRPAADFASDPNNQVVLDDFFRVQWASDPTDVFGRSQSQRQFYTMPSSSIPNDQGSFQNWLYLIPGKTCKEGGRDACVPGTNGAVVTWLSQPN